MDTKSYAFTCTIRGLFMLLKDISQEKAEVLYCFAFISNVLSFIICIMYSQQMCPAPTCIVVEAWDPYITSGTLVPFIIQNYPTFMDSHTCFISQIFENVQKSLGSRLDCR